MKNFNRHLFSIILLIVVVGLLYTFMMKRNVEIVFINSTSNKIPELTLYIDGIFHSTFYCIPGMIPEDFIKIKLPVGKHLIRLVLT
jgi:hypothetical protein